MFVNYDYGYHNGQRITIYNHNFDHHVWDYIRGEMLFISWEDESND